MAEVKHVNDNTFETEVLKSALPVLVDFWAPWCGPCKMLGPVIEGLAGKYAGKLTVCKLNTDESPSTPGKYDIHGIPTVIVFKAGKAFNNRPDHLARPAPRRPEIHQHRQP